MCVNFQLLGVFNSKSEWVALVSELNFFSKISSLAFFSVLKHIVNMLCEYKVNMNENIK